MRTGRHSHSIKYASIQNNLAHYNQILAMRPVVDNHRKEQELSNNHKYAKQVENERRTHNHILLAKLTAIRDKPQSIMKLTMAEFDGPRRRTSLKNEFRERERERELNRSNMGLVKRIRGAKPGIGSISEWQRHENRLQQVRLLRRSTTDDELHFQDEIYNTFTDLMHASIRTKFKLVNEGTRYGSPLKVEVECEVDPQDKKFKRRRRRNKNQHRNKTSPIHVHEEQ